MNEIESNKQIKVINKRRISTRDIEMNDDLLISQLDSKNKRESTSSINSPSPKVYLLDKPKSKKRFSIKPMYELQLNKRKSLKPNHETPSPLLRKINDEINKEDNEMKYEQKRNSYQSNNTKNNTSNTSNYKNYKNKDSISKNKKYQTDQFEGKTMKEFVEEDKQRRITTKMKNQHESKQRLQTPLLNQKGNHYGDLNVFIQLQASTLMSWVGLKTYKILYDKRFIDIKTREFNSLVSGKQNIMIICRTIQGNIFGCFIHKKIPNDIHHHPGYIKKDDKFFVFTLKNKHHESPKRFYKKHNGECVCFYPNYHRIVVSIKHCCHFVSPENSISSDNSIQSKQSYFQKSFERKYKNKQYTNQNGQIVKANYLFFNNTETFDIDKLMVLQFK